MTSTLPSLAFLGAGSMGGAILQGVVASGVPVEQIYATNRTREKAEALTGVTSIALADNPAGNTEAAAAARVVFVGVKPAMVADLLREIAPVLRDDAIVVSLAAGITLDTFAANLGAGVSVIRSMPNTPSTVGKGVTGLVQGSAASDEDVALVRGIFELVGTVVQVEEQRLDLLSSISGSGPAYVYLFIEELTKAGVAKGFSEADARLLAEQTFIGATALLDATGEDPAELRRRVTSPKGTTERAVAVLQDADLAGLFTRATDAAVARSREIAAGA